MLLWEALGLPAKTESGAEDVEAKPVAQVKRAVRAPRLPTDTRCAALTKSGRRCRARIAEGSDFCPFHDPSVPIEQRRRHASKGGRSRKRLTHLPGGYLRTLTSRKAVGEAMDRLYREIRLGVITPEMGTVLFNVLTRIMDSQLCDGPVNGQASKRARADRLRPLVKDLLTQSEKNAWREAIANAPGAFLRGQPQKPPHAGNTDMPQTATETESPQPETLPRSDVPSAKIA